MKVAFIQIICAPASSGTESKLYGLSSAGRVYVYSNYNQKWIELSNEVQERS